MTYPDCYSSLQFLYCKSSHSTLGQTTRPLHVQLSLLIRILSLQPYLRIYGIPGERLSVTKTLGVIVAFSGVFVTVAQDLGNGQASLFGDILVLVSGAFLGLRVVVTKLLIQSIHPYRLLVWYLALSLPVYAILSAIFELPNTFDLTPNGILALLYQGVVIAGFCFLAWTAVLERYSASKLVVLFFATPLSGVLFSHLLLGDELTFYLLAGSLLVAAGIYLVNMQR